MEAAVIPSPIPTAASDSDSSTTPSSNGSTGSSSPPSITTGTDQNYRERAAWVCAHAGITDPFTLLLHQERLVAVDPDRPTPTISDVTPNLLYSNNLIRFDRKISQGAFIVEAHNFAAVACWEPPEVSVFEQAEIWDGADIGRATPYIDRRPIFKDFLTKIAEAKRGFFPRGQKYWHLSLMARDPDRKDKGAVRAVIEPYIQRAREEGLPVWLEAGNERARDVYGWIGNFRVIGEVRSGVGEFDRNGERREGGEGVSTWLMLSNWPAEELRN